MEVRLHQNPDRFLTITIARRVLGAEMEWPTLLERRGHSSVVEPETGVVYRETVFRVTMVFVSVLLCVLILVVCWDSILRCRWRALFHSQPQPEAVIMSKTGLSRKDVDKLPMIRCMASSSRHRYQGVGSECMICLTEFSEGDKVRLLPSCSHGFHVICIDLWLLSNASCPACRHTVLPANGPSTHVRDERQQGDIEST